MCSLCPKLRRSDIVKSIETFCPQRDSILRPLALQASMLPLDHCNLPRWAVRDNMTRETEQKWKGKQKEEKTIVVYKAKVVITLTAFVQYTKKQVYAKTFVKLTALFEAPSFIEQPVRHWRQLLHNCLLLLGWLYKWRPVAMHLGLSQPRYRNCFNCFVIGLLTHKNYHCMRVVPSLQSS